MARILGGVGGGQGSPDILGRGSFAEETLCPCCPTNANRQTGGLMPGNEVGTVHETSRVSGYFRLFSRYSQKNDGEAPRCKMQIAFWLQPERQTLVQLHLAAFSSPSLIPWLCPEVLACP